MADDLTTAVLTKGQREFLNGQREPAQERTMRARIRERIWTATEIDYPLLRKGIDEQRLEPESVVDDVHPNDLVYGLQAQVELVYELAEAGGLNGEDVLQQGLESAKAKHTDDLFEHFLDDPSSLQIHELNLLHDQGEISDQDFVAALKDHPVVGGGGVAGDIIGGSE